MHVTLLNANSPLFFFHLSIGELLGDKVQTRYLRKAVLPPLSSANAPLVAERAFDF